MPDQPKLTIKKDECVKIGDSWYVPIYYTGTGKPTPIAWVRTDFQNSLLQTLELAAKATGL